MLLVHTGVGGGEVCCWCTLGLVEVGWGWWRWAGVGGGGLGLVEVGWVGGGGLGLVEVRCVAGAHWGWWRWAGVGPGLCERLISWAIRLYFCFEHLLARLAKGELVTDTNPYINIVDPALTVNCMCVFQTVGE